MVKRNVLILDGSDNENIELHNTLKCCKSFLPKFKFNIHTFVLRDLNILPCCGFFNCWLKTPGFCARNDIAYEIVDIASYSDFWIFITPIVFGGYSFHLKKAIDRLTPLLLPYFEKVDGEVHHKVRYCNKSALVVFGLLNGCDIYEQSIFSSLVQRNRANFHNNFAVSQFIKKGDDCKSIDKKVALGLKKI